jgi:predicted nucleic acid-binding protein
MKVLFDSNVIVDAFSKREGSNVDARSLCLLVAGDAIDGFLCSKQITDFHYVLRRYIPSEEDRTKVMKILMDSFPFFL